jgi:hypothetical protein
VYTLYALDISDEGGWGLALLADTVKKASRRKDLLVKFEGGGTIAATGEVVGSVDTLTVAAAPVTLHMVINDDDAKAAADAVINERRRQAFIANGGSAPVTSPEAVGTAPVDEVDAGADVSPTPASTTPRSLWLIAKCDWLLAELTPLHLAEAWPDPIPRPQVIKDGDGAWTDDDIDLIADILHGLEDKHALSFDNEDPKTTAARAADLAERLQRDVQEARAERDPLQTDKTTPKPPVEVEFADPDDVTFISKVAQTMAQSTDPIEQARIQRVQDWQRQASNANVSWKLGEHEPGR